MYAYQKLPWDSFSEAEQAVFNTVRFGKPLAVDDLPKKQSRDHMGNIVPARKTYEALDKRGLVVLCEPISDEETGFEFTAHVELA